MAATARRAAHGGELTGTGFMAEVAIAREHRWRGVRRHTGGSSTDSAYLAQGRNTEDAPSALPPGLAQLERRAVRPMDRPDDVVRAFLLFLTAVTSLVRSTWSHRTLQMNAELTAELARQSIGPAFKAPAFALARPGGMGWSCCSVAQGDPRVLVDAGSPVPPKARDALRAMLIDRDIPNTSSLLPCPTDALMEHSTRSPKTSIPPHGIRTG